MRDEIRKIIFVSVDVGLRRISLYVHPSTSSFKSSFQVSNPPNFSVTWFPQHFYNFHHYKFSLLLQFEFSWISLCPEYTLLNFIYFTAMNLHFFTFLSFLILRFSNFFKESLISSIFTMLQHPGEYLDFKFEYDLAYILKRPPLWFTHSLGAQISADLLFISVAHTTGSEKQYIRSSHKIGLGWNNRPA